MKGPNILTITLNPSLDRTLIVHYLGIGYHNHTIESTRLDPAGEGFAISRALSRLDCSTQAIVLLGTDATGTAYRALAEEETFPFTPIASEGRTRSKTILLDTGNKTETQITDEGAQTRAQAVDKVAEALRRAAKPGDIVVLAGSLPAGAPRDSYASLVQVARQVGAQAAVSGSGAVLETTLPAKPGLIMLTRMELEGFFNYPVREFEDIIECARKIQVEGAERVLVQLNEKGNALLLTPEETLSVELELEDSGTSSGVWPALIAGYLAGRAHQKPVAESLAFGAAAATFTARQVGHEFGTPPELEPQADAAEPLLKVNEARSEEKKE